MSQQATTVMIVEDDKIDAEAIKRAFEKSDFQYPLQVARNGLEALQHLRGTGGVEKLPQPTIVILDLNMPQMNGFEFLDFIRSDKELDNTIVFVLTTSDCKKDKVAAYRRNIAGYLVKSKIDQDYEALVNMIKFYCDHVELPQKTKSVYLPDPKTRESYFVLRNDQAST